MDTGLQPEQLLQQQNLESQLSQLQAQLAYFQGWAGKLAAAQYSRSLSMPVVLAAVQILVCGFPEGTTEVELAACFCELVSAHAAAVAPGPAVTMCRLLRHQPYTALLELRCPIEASNCMAFDGIQFKGCTLKVQRPKEYKPDAAILLGPQQPDPAVYAALSCSAEGSHAAAALQQLQQQNPADQQHAGQASVVAAAAPGNNSTGSFAVALRSSAAASGLISCSRAALTHSGGGAAAAGVCSSSRGGGSSSSSTFRSAYRDFVPAADQSKQDEVFIGGLPSHWKAQQVKELLAPYGQLKSLSVAMDAATGKNKGYAFVVFASSAVVPRAIEELDCKVVDGKILAVQRATDGKAAPCGSSMAKEIPGSSSSSSGGNASSALGVAVAAHDTAGDAAANQQEQQYQQRQPHRSSSGSSSCGGATSSGPLSAALTVPAAAAAVAAGSGSGGISVAPAAGSALAAGRPAVPEGLATAQKQQHLQHSRSSASQQAAAALAASAAAVGAGDSGSTLGQRLLAAVSGGSAAGGTGSTKQYDVNELYIGDLPLSWDEDAVRRLLGRYGKIKYFTLRNGRDKNFAFCKFKDSSVVDAAIQGLHGKIVDGYFLNVRRAIEGKQQQQQQWPGKQAGSRMPSDAGNSRAAQPQQRAPDHQQQQQQQRTGMWAGAFERRAAADMAAGAHAPAAAARPAETGNIQDTRQQPEQQTGEAAAADAVPLRPAAAAAAGATGGGSADPNKAQKQQQQQQHDDISSASTAPSPPSTPTVPAMLQQQPAGPVQKPPLQQQQQLPPLFQPLMPVPLQQQQQQQHVPSLFLNHSGPGGSWGAPALGTVTTAVGSGAASGAEPLETSYRTQQQQQQQQQQHSLLQTWDMLSPWSLFSPVHKAAW